MKCRLLIIALFIVCHCKSQNLAQDMALADFEEFVNLLESQSSYYQISDFDFVNQFENVRNKIKEQDSIPIHYLAFQMERIIAETLDRHANVRMSDFNEDDYESYDLFFPFILAPYNDKVLALKRGEKKREYDYYIDRYPYLKSIDGVDLDSVLQHWTYRRKNAPRAAQVFDGIRDIRDYGELLFKNGIESQKSVEVVLTDGDEEKKLTLPLTDKKNRWHDVATRKSGRFAINTMLGKEVDFNELDQWLTDSIAYMSIPKMVDFEDYPACKPYLDQTMSKYQNAKALIVDLRSNGGGSREILNCLAPYFIQKEESPWVANLAYVRSDQYLDEDIESMQYRYLYNYYSDNFSDDDRLAIDSFDLTFDPKYAFEEDKFSTPYYMLLKSGAKPLKCPIYLLVNEQSFSAASVFTSAFKGLPNVKVAGVTTNGSSGRSQRFKLKHSNISIKLSSMLSFQRSGYPLDGHGTIPDIVIERNESQVFGKSDYQLEKLLEIVTDQNNK